MEAYSKYYLMVFVFLIGVHGTLQEQIKENSLEIHSRFLLDQNYTKPWISLEQFVSCSLTCIPGYEKLTEACCNTGIDAVCLNLPWDVLKTSLGRCTGRILSTVQASSYQTALQQFASCSLICIHGYEKLTDICCTTGIKEVCSNLPWDLLKPYLGLCKAGFFTTSPSTTNPSTPAQGQLYGKTTIHPSTSQVTTPSTIVTTLATIFATKSSTTTPTTKPPPYWLPWGQWTCEFKQGACFQRRYRNCSTGSDSDCKKGPGGNQYAIGLCTSASCPVYLTPKSSAMPTTTPQAACQDNPNSGGCANPDLLTELCKETQLAWEFCPASCNLCDTCWDFLDCSTTGAVKLFCSREQFALQYCRKTCGKCDHKPVHVPRNRCGDPVANEFICETLQTELCICNDPSVRGLCEKYCDNKCKDHQFVGSNCTPDTRRKRDEVLQRYLSL